MSSPRFSSRIFLTIGLLVMITISVYIALGEGIEDRVRNLAGIGGVPHSWGTFRSTNGNAGLINYGAAPKLNGYTGAHILSHYESGTITNTLTGYLWMENIGWVGAGGVTLYPDPTGNPRGNWTLSGFLWSDSAGWIDMNHVVFVPDNTFFSGFAWNDGVGWIDTWGATLATTSSGFIGKVKIIGNIASSYIYNTVYDVGQSYSSTKINGLINSIQKNLSIMLRNVPQSQINRFDGTTNIEAYNDTVIYLNTGTTVNTLRYSTASFRHIGFEDVRSLIVIGANLYIDEAVIVPPGDTRPRVIIVMPNEAGIGGNIYIAGNPTRIESTLVAGGSLFSAYFPPNTDTEYVYYNTDAASTINLPDRQLYVFGSLISHNTIGGSTPDNGNSFICPYLELDCTRATAIRYDLNYFRDYQKDPVKRGYPNSAYDDWSIIIEYNQGLTQDPPPGLAE